MNIKRGGKYTCSLQNTLFYSIKISFCILKVIRLPLETIIKFQQSVHSINGCAWEGEKCTLKFLSQNELSDLKRDEVRNDKAICQNVGCGRIFLYTKLSKAKLKCEIFNGTQIRHLMKNTDFIKIMSVPEIGA